MLVYKNGSDKDILGFQCDRCDHTTLTNVIPNDHGEYRYICPKCGYKMNDRPAEKEEETSMVNTYTVSNAAKRLNCSTATIGRAIQDGRFHDCFMEAGYHGRPAWMIPSDQVEEWVTRGGFLQMGKVIKQAPTKEEIDAFKKNVGKLGQTQKSAEVETVHKPHTVFDPEVGKEVEVLNLFGDIPIKENEDFSTSENDTGEVLDEFRKRAIRRVAKKKDEPEKKYVNVLDRDANGETISAWSSDGKPIAGRYPWDKDNEKELLDKMNKLPAGDQDGDSAINVLDDNTRNRMMLEAAREEFRKESTSPNQVVRTDNGFTITFPTDMIESMVQRQFKDEISVAVGQLRTAFDLLNDELKKLEEAIA